MACADFANLGGVIRTLENVEALGALHFDFCDGHFAPTFLFSPMILRSLRPLTRLRFDAHMYCQYPSRYLDELAECGANCVIVQVECSEDYKDVVGRVGQKGMDPGIGILPWTEISPDIEEIAPAASIIVANTVGPAYAGQRFDPRGLHNIRKLRNMSVSRGWTIDIAADGGVNIDTIDSLLHAGANFFVLGSSSVFRQGLDLGESISLFYREIEFRMGE
jgi:ribulose-phosphate 3-epimerase